MTDGIAIIDRVFKRSAGIKVLDRKYLNLTEDDPVSRDAEHDLGAPLGIWRFAAAVALQPGEMHGRDLDQLVPPRLRLGGHAERGQHGRRVFSARRQEPQCWRHDRDATAAQVRLGDGAAGRLGLRPQPPRLAAPPGIGIGLVELGLSHPPRELGAVDASARPVAAGVPFAGQGGVSVSGVRPPASRRRSTAAEWPPRSRACTRSPCSWPAGFCTCGVA